MDPPEDWNPSEEERDGFDSVTCTVCKQWILRPIPRTCPNDHPSALCEDCAIGLVAQASKRGIFPKCPTCRAYFKKDKDWSRDLQKCIMQGMLSAFCPNGEASEDGSRTGCTKHLKLSKMQDHLDNCPYVEHPCRFGARGCHVRSFEITAHEVTCPKRPVLYQYWSVVFLGVMTPILITPKNMHLCINIGVL